MTSDGGQNVIKILLVDDIAEARDGIKRLLSFEMDFKVIDMASNGREGVQKALQLRPDIVIMDINMPDMDGLEAASQITKNMPEVGVIMMSVQDDPDYMQRAMLAGARFFISKPPSTDQLYSTIRNVYEQYGPIRERIKASDNILPPIIDNTPTGPGSRPGHVIAVYSPQGGSGKTLMATNLASGLMKEGIKTLLIDADLEFGDVSAYLDLRAQMTLVEVVDNADDLDVEYFDNIVMTHNSGMKVLVAPPTPAAGAEIRDTTPGSVRIVIENIRHYYDFVVVDLPCSLDAATVQILDVADKIVLVTVPTLPAIKNTRLVLNEFDQSEFPKTKTSLVVNRAIENPTRSQRGYPTPDKIASYLKQPVEGVIPLVEETFILNAINKGVPVIALGDPNRSLIKQLTAYSDHLYKTLMGEEDIVDEQEETSSKDSQRKTIFPGFRR